MAKRTRERNKQRAIEELVKMLSTTPNYTRRRADRYLEIIGKGNTKAIYALVKLFSTTHSEATRRRAAQCLEIIGKGNRTAIRTLVELLNTSHSEATRGRAVESLGVIGDGNPIGIQALVELLSTTRNEDTRRRAAESLGVIGDGNPIAIQALVELLSTTRNKDTWRQAFESLKKIDSSNKIVIEFLVKAIEAMLSNVETPDNRKKVSDILSQFGIGHQKTIEKLRKIRHDPDPFTRWLVRHVLEKIDTSSYTKDQDLLLFLDVTRVRETADRYFNLNSPGRTEFCHHRIIACLDQIQTGQDIFTKRSLLNSYLDTYQRIISFALQRDDLNRAFFYTEIFRNRYLVERLSQQDTSLPETISPELAQAIKEAQQRETKALQKYTSNISRNLPQHELEELARKWDEQKSEIEELYSQVAAIEPEFIAKTKVTPLTYSQVQDLLPVDTAILEFFFTKDKLLIMLILPGAESPLFPDELRISLPSNSLETLANTWVGELNSKFKQKEIIEQNIESINNAIDRISDYLHFDQLLNYIPKEIQHLIIVPHNYLHLFPIHAFWVNHAEKKRLIDCFSVSYFPSLQVWKICQKRQRLKNSLIGIENPTQDKDLIFAKAEIASISQSRYFSHVHILPSENLSKNNVIETASGYHCFHFSGHGEYDFSNPLNSYLMLSKQDEENLTLDTIFAHLRMPQANLVILSACCTGVVDAFQPTEEYLGLPTGFLLAGAKAVISSQWKVNSISTAFLFDEFYRQLEICHNKAVALQKAQSWLRQCPSDDLRKRSKEWDLSKLEPKERSILYWTLEDFQGIPFPFENPYYWAAFTSTGC